MEGNTLPLNRVLALPLPECIYQPVINKPCMTLKVCCPMRQTTKAFPACVPCGSAVKREATLLFLAFSPYHQLALWRPWLDGRLHAVAHCDACKPLMIHIRAVQALAVLFTGRAHDLHLLLCTSLLADRKVCPCRHWQQKIWT